MRHWCERASWRAIWQDPNDGPVIASRKGAATQRKRTRVSWAPQASSALSSLLIPHSWNSHLPGSFLLDVVNRIHLDMPRPQIGWGIRGWRQPPESYTQEWLSGVVQGSDSGADPDWPPIGRLPGEVWELLSFLRGSPGTFHSMTPVSCSALTVYDSYAFSFYCFRDSADSYQEESKMAWGEFRVRMKMRCIEFKDTGLGTSLVAQWLRPQLPMQGAWVQSLVGEQRAHMICGPKTEVMLDC